jgi:hypothetical protein
LEFRAVPTRPVAIRVAETAWHCRPRHFAFNLVDAHVRQRVGAPGRRSHSISSPPSWSSECASKSAKLDVLRTSTLSESAKPYSKAEVQRLREKQPERIRFGSLMTGRSPKVYGQTGQKVAALNRASCAWRTGCGVALAEGVILETNLLQCGPVTETSAVPSRRTPNSCRPIRRLRQRSRLACLCPPVGIR